jgi:hypothetical protein
MTSKKQIEHESPADRLEKQQREHPPFLLRSTLKGNFEVAALWPPGFNRNLQPRRCVQAVLRIDGGTAVAHVCRRKANVAGILTMAQIADHRVVRLLAPGGRLLAGAPA